jgi:hypothetical protein
MFTLWEGSRITPSRLDDLGMAGSSFSRPEFLPGQGGLFEHVESFQLKLMKVLDYMGTWVSTLSNQHMQYCSTRKKKEKRTVQ